MRSGKGASRRGRSQEQQANFAGVDRARPKLTAKFQREELAVPRRNREAKTKKPEITEKEVGAKSGKRGGEQSQSGKDVVRTCETDQMAVSAQC